MGWTQARASLQAVMASLPLHGRLNCKKALSRSVAMCRLWSALSSPVAISANVIRVSSTAYPTKALLVMITVSPYFNSLLGEKQDNLSSNQMLQLDFRRYTTAFKQINKTYSN